MALLSSYSAGHFEFALDGGPPTTFVRSIEGGTTKRNFTSEAIGTDNQPIKHATSNEHEPFTVEIGLSAARDVMRWARSTWRKEGTRRNGMVVHGDFTKKSRNTQAFCDAVLLELGFPALDANAKDSGYLKVKFMPEEVETVPSPGVAMGGVTNPLQKGWQTSAFRLSVDGVPLFGINKIEAFTIKHSFSPLATGRDGVAELVPHKIEFPNLIVHMSAANAAPVRAWHEVSKRGLDFAGYTGCLEFLDPTRTFPLFRLNLADINIVDCNFVRAEASAEAIKRVRFELSIGSMDVDDISGMM